MSNFTRQEWEDARSDYVNKKMSSDVYASMCFMYINSLEQINTNLHSLINKSSSCDGCEYYERTDARVYHETCKDCSRLIRYDRFKDKH